MVCVLIGGGATVRSVPERGSIGSGAQSSDYPRGTWWRQADALGYRLRAIRRGPPSRSFFLHCTYDRGRTRQKLGSARGGVVDGQVSARVWPASPRLSVVPLRRTNRSDHWERLWITPVRVPVCPPAPASSLAVTRDPSVRRRRTLRCSIRVRGSAGRTTEIVREGGRGQDADGRRLADPSSMYEARG